MFPVHEGKFSSSLLFENLKVREDFDSRGIADFKSNVVGSQFSYGLSNQLSAAIKGGAIIDPLEKAQGSEWQGRAGYLYGFDIINEVFPATDVQPGVQLSGGITGFQVPFDRLIAGNTVTLIDQKISGFHYHGAVLATSRWGRFSPYSGLRVFGSKVTWRNNQPGATGPDKISGHAKGHISVVVGFPFQLSQDVKIQAEGVFLNETMLSAGLTVAVF